MRDKDRTRNQLLGELSKMQKIVAELEERMKNFQRAEDRLHEKIVEYEKLSALGRLTANVAHEIRNPITVIGGLTRRLQKSFSINSEQREYLDLIMIEVKRLEDLLRDILTFSDKTIRREEHDIHKVINNCLNIFKNIFERQSITVKKIYGNVPKIFIAEKQVKEVINNLISNAVDAMPQGGKLSFSTTTDYINEKAYAVLSIADTGYGIPQENMKMIFEPFFTTKMTKKETGLGLSIAKKIMELHGGFIKVESEIGKGSIFSLYFPFRKRT